MGLGSGLKAYWLGVLGRGGKEGLGVRDRIRNSSHDSFCSDHILLYSET